MTGNEINIDEFIAAAMGEGMMSLDIQSMLEAYPDLLHELASYDPFKLAATYGGLLTVPELQSNCLRLESLCHLALLCANGTRNPNVLSVTRSFAALDDGPIGRLEDPAEDVFVTSVTTARGNFLVLEGIWETAGFYLQRFLNVIDTIPTGYGYDDLRETVYALLMLSDTVCVRATLVRWQMGAPAPQLTLPQSIANSIRDLRSLVSFTESELADLGISLDHLMEFVLPSRECEALAEEELGHTSLERRPVLRRNKDICLALPTGVSMAIRRLILERISSISMREVFLRFLAEEYAELFAQMPLLGGKIHAPIRFQRTTEGVIAAVMTQVDVGRYVAFVFIMDTLEDVEITGIAGMDGGWNRMETTISQSIRRAAEAAQQNDDFQEGITLIVSCGVGRGLAASMPRSSDSHWRVAFLSAPDLVTLSWTNGFTPLSLWRLLDAQAQLEGAGVHLQNANGLLNLVAWQRSLRGHLIPHNDIPDGFTAEGHQALLVVDQTALKSLRHEVATTWDPHIVQDITGTWIHVRKLSDSLFKEEKVKPLYVGNHLLESGCLPSVYITPKRAWWCETVVSSKTERSMAYERWQMLNVWLARISPILDARLLGLPSGPLLWRVEFEADFSPAFDPGPNIGLEDAMRAISVAADRKMRTLNLRVGKAFEAAHFNVENFAERALVERTVDGFQELTGTVLTEDERTALLKEIIQDVHSRQIHAFCGRSFRDHIREKKRRSVVLINEDDAAALRLGLGWRVRNRADGCDLAGKSDCVSFLNAVTRMLEEELLAELTAFNRSPLIEVLLVNHERAAIDRDRWNRTSAAMMALHADKQATANTIIWHESQMNAVFLSTRALIEMAHCACSVNGGRKAGELDLSRLMAKMMQIIQLGGWSDAMWLDAMEARIHINPLGDIQVNHSFIDTVADPFGRVTSEERTKDAINSYARNLEENTLHESVEDTFEDDFNEAFQEEFGIGIDEMRTFLDFIENIGVEQNRLVLALPRSSLLNQKVGDNTTSPESAAACIAVLTLPCRDNWHVVPEGYDDKDRHPWRFRRRLSVLRKPLIQIDNELDPTLMIAPGLVRDAVIYSLGNYYRGDFPQHQLKPKMKSWRGKATDKRGTDFNTEVAERMRALGWQAAPDVKMSTILGAAFKSYGDIDVLAWKPDGGRVLLIECKNLKFSKTVGEIAEQLADFRGEKRANGKPDDLLKHLNRISAIVTHPTELTRFLAISSPPIPEGHIVFRNPVPMQFVWERLKERIGLHLFEELSAI
jgi:hypothetical protein